METEDELFLGIERREKMHRQCSGILGQQKYCITMVCVCACVPAAQSCPTLCNPIDSSPPGSSAIGILQARILEWVAFPVSKGSS